MGRLERGEVNIQSTVSPMPEKVITQVDSGGRLSRGETPIETTQQPAEKTQEKSLFGGLVGTLAKILNVGTDIQTGVTEKILESQGILKPSGRQLFSQIGQLTSNVDLLKRIGGETDKGGLLTGQYKASENWWENLPKELPSAAVGVLADIFLDPVTYLNPLSIFGKVIPKTIQTTVKEGFKALKEIPAVEKITTILGRAFITRYGQREVFKEADIARKTAESLVSEEVGRIVMPIIESSKVTQQRVTQLMKGGITTDEELKAIAQPLREELDRVGESISQLNPKLLSEETFEANRGTYFPRLYTKYEFPTEEELVESFFRPRAVSIPKERFTQRILTEEEALAKPELIKEAGYPAQKALTQLRVAEIRQKFFKEVTQIASDNPNPGWIQLSKDKALGELAGKFLPAAEYRAIAELRRIPTKLEEIYMKGLTLWKTFKTAYNPSTISRNDLTNFLILNPLGGVGPHRIDIYAKAFSEFASKGHLYQLARKNGLEISTQQAAELTRQATRFYKENGGLIKQFFHKVENFHEAVKDFYGNQDKFFKLANFIKGVTEDGLGPREAMRRANFYLIDYSEIPELVGWLRRSPFGIPFISFTYGVSKPLAKTLLENPGKLATYFKILKGIQNMNPMRETPEDLQREKDIIPDWINEGVYLRFPIKDKFGRSQYVDLQYILPFNALEEKSLSPSTPLLTIFAALFANKDTFTGKEIVKETDSGGEKLSKRTRYILQQLLPGFAPFGYDPIKEEVVGGASFEKIKSLLLERPDLNGYVRQTLPVLLDVLGGIKVTPVDLTVGAQIKANERRKELEEINFQLRKIMLDKSLFPQEKEKQRKVLEEKRREILTPQQ